MESYGAMAFGLITPSTVCRPRLAALTVNGLEAADLVDWQVAQDHGDINRSRKHTKHIGFDLVHRSAPRIVAMGEFVNAASLPFTASKIVLMVAAFCGPDLAWIGLQATIDFGFLPNL